MRADQLLVSRGLAASRSQAARLIESGARWQRMGHKGLEWRTLSKSDEVPDDAPIELADSAESRYVSRGGLKLEGALAAASLDVTGWHCLDVGQSTGGFTDCLLQHGAADVTGVDVGHGQLHERIRSDARVLCYEGINARELDASFFIAENDQPAGTPGGFFKQFDLIAGDLSFISQTLVLPALVPLLRPGGSLLMLVKPQFELQPGQVGKGGIVRDPALYAVVERRIRDACQALGLQSEGWFDSPVAGGDGNREFFIYARTQA